MAIMDILWPFGIFYDHLVYVFVGHCNIFSRFGIFYQEKSGNQVEKNDLNILPLMKMTHFRVPPTLIKNCYHLAVRAENG
jgi:hypothetical protein